MVGVTVTVAVAWRTKHSAKLPSGAQVCLDYMRPRPPPRGKGGGTTTTAKATGRGGGRKCGEGELKEQMMMI